MKTFFSDLHCLVPHNNAQVPGTLDPQMVIRVDAQL